VLMARLAPSARRARTALRARKVRAFGCLVLRLRLWLGLARIAAGLGVSLFLDAGATGKEGAPGKDGKDGKNGRDGQPGALPSPRRHGMSSALECCRATPALMVQGGGLTGTG